MHLPTPMRSGESDGETKSDHEEEESDNLALRGMTECSSESDSHCSEAECFDMD